MGKPNKKQFDWEHYDAFVNEFRDESDRAAVVLGAAKLDLVMYQILKAHLIPCAGSKDELLDGDSPLGTFSAKINMMYRLGLIDSGFARALHIIRKIRNSFAHEVSGCSLESGAHRDRVKELSLPLQNLPFFAEFKDAFFREKTGPGIDFRAVLAILVGRLEDLLVDVDVTGTEDLRELINPPWKKDLEKKRSNNSLQSTAESGD